MNDTLHRICISSMHWGGFGLTRARFVYGYCRRGPLFHGVPLSHDVQYKEVTDEEYEDYICGNIHDPDAFSSNFHSVVYQPDLDDPQSIEEWTHKNVWWIGLRHTAHYYLSRFHYESWQVGVFDHIYTLFVSLTKWKRHAQHKQCRTFWALLVFFLTLLSCSQVCILPSVSQCIQTATNTNNEDFVSAKQVCSHLT